MTVITSFGETARHRTPSASTVYTSLYQEFQRNIGHQLATADGQHDSASIA